MCTWNDVVKKTSFHGSNWQYFGNSPAFGAGQQCCYDSTGAQVLTGDSIGGSTPDRAHDWGSPPYKKPPRVPGQSHWVYDVLSFYYCCLWSDNCHYYFKHRPSSDCRRYQAPKSGQLPQQCYRLLSVFQCSLFNLFCAIPAVVFGDPHFITFDGVSYSFNGKGEYNLVTSRLKRLTIQGRTEPVNGEKAVSPEMYTKPVWIMPFPQTTLVDFFPPIRCNKSNKTDSCCHERSLLRYYWGASGQQSQ